MFKYFARCQGHKNKQTPGFHVQELTVYLGASYKNVIKIYYGDFKCK